MVSLMSANDSDISVIPSDSAKSVVTETQNDSPLTIRKPVFKTPVKCEPFFRNIRIISSLDGGTHMYD